MGHRPPPCFLPLPITALYNFAPPLLPTEFTAPGHKYDMVTKVAELDTVVMTVDVSYKLDMVTNRAEL